MPIITNQYPAPDIQELIGQVQNLTHNTHQLQQQVSRLHNQTQGFSVREIFDYMFVVITLILTLPTHINRIWKWCKTKIYGKQTDQTESKPQLQIIVAGDPPTIVDLYTEPHHNTDEIGWFLNNATEIYVGKQRSTSPDPTPSTSSTLNPPIHNTQSSDNNSTHFTVMLDDVDDKPETTLTQTSTSPTHPGESTLALRLYYHEPLPG